MIIPVVVVVGGGVTVRVAVRVSLGRPSDGVTVNV
jgi:hypothetical protein